MAAVRENYPVPRTYFERQRSSPSYCKVGFYLEIRTFFERADSSSLSSLKDKSSSESSAVFRDKQVVSTFEFGKARHRNRVAHLLREAGFNPATIETKLDETFSCSKSMVEEYQTKHGVFTDLILMVWMQAYKFVRCEDDEDDVRLAVAGELSMLDQLAAPAKAVPAAKESVNLLKKVQPREEEEEEEELGDCMICMEALCHKRKVVVVTMPCSHLFHGRCIKQWLKMDHTCPSCRFLMPTHH